jgi:EAL domain-containing protein (putative c-di-GMP-specific phosphodiesterase class I)
MPSRQSIPAADPTILSTSPSSKPGIKTASVESAPTVNTPVIPSNLEFSRPRHVLLVDDDADVVRSLGRVLRARGYLVTATTSAIQAVELVTQSDFDVILSDINMPEMDGIMLLRNVRAHDLHVPVILLTGKPTVDTAVMALEHGALHYLTKPIHMDTLEHALDKAVHLRRMARLRQRASELLGQATAHAADRVGLETSFQRCLDSLWMAFHPIVDATTHVSAGYEALLRSREPSLPHPGAVLDAAERLDQLELLGRTVRDRSSIPFADHSRTELLFVNLHVTDLLDPQLLSPSSALSQIANQVVLEITERASLDKVPDVRARIGSLREMGFRIAIDDLGAGYSGLTSFALLEPDYVKLDMSLVRGVDSNTTKQRIVRSMASLCREMGMRVVAEGVETPQECATLIDLECDLLQGFLFALPGPALPEVRWPEE